MKKNKLSQKLKELPPPQPPSDSNEVILDLESNNKENVAPNPKSKKKNLKRTLSDNHKNYKDLDKNFLPMFSLKSGDSNFSPIKWLLNALSKMQLNMNVCYEIIENMDLDSSFDKETTLNIIIDRYFMMIDDFTNERNFSNSNFKITQSLIYKKMFMKKRKTNQKKDFLLTKTTKDELIIDIDTKSSPKPFLFNMHNGKKCNICYEDLGVFKIIPGSNHEFCNNCVKAHLKYNIENNNVLKIMCPDDCGYKLTEKNIADLLSEEYSLLKKYQKFKLNAELSQDPNLMWCMNPGCENIITSEKNAKLIICTKCDLRMCFTCKGLWHEGQTCDQAIESEYKKYIDKVAVKQCPKCKVRIEKNLGCNHMTCVRCHHQFCWICSKRYTPYHYKWYNLLGCPGLQNTNIVNIRGDCMVLNKLKIFFKILGTIILALCGVALFPIIWFFASLIFPLVYFYNNYKGPCFSIFFFFLFIICLLFSPITMIVMFFIGIVLMIFNPKLFTLTNEE